MINSTRIKFNSSGIHEIEVRANLLSWFDYLGFSGTRPIRTGWLWTGWLRSRWAPSSTIASCSAFRVSCARRKLCRPTEWQRVSEKIKLTTFLSRRDNSCDHHQRKDEHQGAPGWRKIESECKYRPMYRPLDEVDSSERRTLAHVTLMILGHHKL